MYLGLFKQRNLFHRTFEQENLYLWIYFTTNIGPFILILLQTLVYGDLFYYKHWSIHTYFTTNIAPWKLILLGPIYFTLTSLSFVISPAAQVHV
jgi:hypothetical protein